MIHARACDRLPDVRLELEGCTEARLHDFLGQKLVLFFCPTDDREAAVREIESYARLAPAFEQAGSWVIGMVGAREDAPPAEPGAHLRVGVDETGLMFRELTDCLADTPPPPRDAGMVLIVERGGLPRHAWAGTGHAQQALASVRERP
jgi:hypothetical protein